MTVVTNQKTSFDGDINPDIDARAITTAGTLSGTIAQIVGLSVNNSGTETVINTANPLPVTTTPTTAVTTTETNPTSTTSSTTALAANANRKGGYLVNDSDTDIHVSWGGTATTSRQKVRANGGSINFVISGMVYTGAVNTIHAGSGSKTLYCVEIT